MKANPQDTLDVSHADETISAPVRRAGLWPRLVDARIGVLPVPLFLLMAAVLAGLTLTGKLPNDIVTSIVLLSVGGFACAELGKRIPVLNKMGAPSILATFVPSALVFYHVLPAPFIKSVTEWTKFSNFLYLCIAAIIVGSILGMDRRVLMVGFFKVIVPLALGSLAAAAVGTLVGTALGIGAYRSFFFIVVPIMAGGVGEGAIPLSIGYATLLGLEQGTLFGQILPSVMLGSLSAILFSGILDSLGKRYPRLSGNGALFKSENDDFAAPANAAPRSVALQDVWSGLALAVTLYLLGYIVQRLTHFPAPVLMLLFAVLLKIGRILPPHLEHGAYRVYRFFAVCVNFPLLFAVGVALTPWEELMAALSFANVLTIMTTVATLMGTGFVVSRWLRMNAIEAAIVNACHSGQGSTGDLAILSAANRLGLMPFAQVATRLGGAATVTIALIVMRWFL
ncbi:2-hydroxycarboxylate transporter family protein [Chitinasiproducens palmae]|uniref:Citrate carrier protein, CCS family n=1 Tax=Chitinasiproducens palmae TaxID=1770053 RepID=A0A1H2PQN3_9BURK|nr:2-hydroxycarboxylate transporter family protein [Chitinasiproducens palmae]SDV48727.1 citrate carrier protein, CCS family [Chitinasiproducens palmae]